LLVSSLYFVVFRLLELIALVARGDREKEVEILVLRHELSIFRRQVGRPRFEPHDRLLLAALSRVLPQRRCGAFLVRPETLLRWHRRVCALEPLSNARLKLRRRRFVAHTGTRPQPDRCS
jgi:putative transposase